MKTKSLFLVALMLLFAGTTMAQNYAFRVLTAKGNNTASKNAIRVGSKLNNSDVIVMEQGGYLGLLHTNGQTVELRTKGTYKVNELANNLKASNNSSLTSRYANYVVSELTSSTEEASGENRYKHMKKTGAVIRGSKTAVTILQENKVTMLGDKMEIEWFVYEELAKINKEDVKEYRVVLTDLRNNELYSETTTETSYLIDFSRPELKDQKTILYRVEIADEDKKGIKSNNQVIAKEKESNAKKETREQLDQIGDNTTALGNLIKAQYLEEKGYNAEAAMAYKAAMNLAPDVETYKVLYQNFTERTEMSKEAIITDENSTNE
ncbi:hypothetical protein Fleli_3060 [Bernardetia litoralis DSM 6794]|uniref:Tetratricopeptide repeat protein n=1 Tax=Bernardetia litoralis (strain ATCC 23117 / DSM 6794 / NBRC 15988 / NCIMB 1366 / Fx l1 / Sio-4) TaxID=880071 RepID=I4AN65_BERLS|nr:hypothetical protein [Bernardetia litoralis]AFM05400.1 hypothetical protein Fleli_3060 [Bernardetia litoralis DSM 6794]